MKLGIDDEDQDRVCNKVCPPATEKMKRIATTIRTRPRSIEQKIRYTREEPKRIDISFLAEDPRGAEQFSI